MGLAGAKGARRGGLPRRALITGRPLKPGAVSVLTPGVGLFAASPPPAEAGQRGAKAPVEHVRPGRPAQAGPQRGWRTGPARPWPPAPMPAPVPSPSFGMTGGSPAGYGAILNKLELAR